jgi:hypothetical protein
MKKYVFTSLVLTILLSACVGSKTDVASTATLMVSDGATKKTYSLKQLQALSKSEATFNNVDYVGVSLATLLHDAGYDMNSVQSVKAIADDGFSAVYDSGLFNRPDVLVAYAQKDGPLNIDDGAFRMVLPGEEGKLNVRMLVEIDVTP